MKNLIVLVLLIACASCKTKPLQKATNLSSQRIVTEVIIYNIIEDSLLNVRAIEILELAPNKEACVFLTSRGEFGSIFPNGIITSDENGSHGTHLINLSSDSLKLNFRALAASKDKGFGITIGSPALLYKLDADLEKNKIVYQENHEKAFYDSMDFWERPRRHRYW